MPFANLNFDPPGLNWPCRDAQGPLPVKIIFNEAKVEEGLAGYPELKAAVLAGLDAAEVPVVLRARVVEVGEVPPVVDNALRVGVGEPDAVERRVPERRLPVGDVPELHPRRSY